MPMWFNQSVNMMSVHKKSMRFLVVLGWVLLLVSGFLSSADRVWANIPTFEELKERYVPQPTPDSAYQLELELMVQGLYCYDLPLFDPQWRSKGKELLVSDKFKSTAELVNRHFTAKIKGDYAVIYFPKQVSISPVFLYHVADGWIIDRTVTSMSILFESMSASWVFVEEQSPYFEILNEIFNLERIQVSDQRWGYKLKKSSPLREKTETL